MTEREIGWLRLRDHLAEAHAREPCEYGTEPEGRGDWHQTLGELLHRHRKLHRDGTRRCGHWHPFGRGRLGAAALAGAGGLAGGPGTDAVQPLELRPRLAQVAASGGFLFGGSHRLTGS